MVFHKYKHDPFIKSIIENPNMYNSEEIVLLGYLPIIIIKSSPKIIQQNLEACFLGHTYKEHIKNILDKLNMKLITNWIFLKDELWIFIQSLLQEYMDIQRNLFKIILKTILLLKMRLLICIENFFPETLIIPKDIFKTYLCEEDLFDLPEIKHTILTIMMTMNQTLLHPGTVGERIYSDNDILMNYITETFTFIPEDIHLGIIMDGNRRWGKVKRLPGHFFGTCKTEELLRWTLKITNIEELTLYCLSIDNLEKRNIEELQILETLLQIYLSQLIESKSTLQKNLEIIVIGEVERLSDKTRLLIDEIHKEYGEETKYRRKRLNLAIAYDPIKDSKRILTEKNTRFNTYLRRPIDYVIRCGDVTRTSGFFPLNTIYSEWLFLSIMWPDMSYEILINCLKEFGDRQRRFGK